MNIQEIQEYAKKHRLPDKWWISDGIITSEQNYSLAEIEEQDQTVYLLNVSQTDNWLKLQPSVSNASNKKEKASEKHRPLAPKAIPTSSTDNIKLHLIKEPKQSTNRKLPWIAGIAITIILAGLASPFIYKHFYKPATKLLLPLKTNNFGLRVLMVQAKEGNVKHDIIVVDSLGKKHHWNKIDDTAITENGSYKLSDIDSQRGKLIVHKSHPLLTGLLIKTIKIDREALERLNDTRGAEIDDFLANNPRPHQTELSNLQSEIQIISSQIKYNLDFHEAEQQQLLDILDFNKSLSAANRTPQQKSITEKSNNQLTIVNNEIELLTILMKTYKRRISEIRTRIEITLNK